MQRCSPSSTPSAAVRGVATACAPSVQCLQTVLVSVQWGPSLVNCHCAPAAPELHWPLPPLFTVMQCARLARQRWDAGFALKAKCRGGRCQQCGLPKGTTLIAKVQPLQGIGGGQPQQQQRRRLRGCISGNHYFSPGYRRSVAGPLLDIQSTSHLVNR